MKRAGVAWPGPARPGRAGPGRLGPTRPFSSTCHPCISSTTPHTHTHPDPSSARISRARPGPVQYRPAYDSTSETGRAGPAKMGMGSRGPAGGGRE